jgi:hypothetical protein
VDAGTFQPTKKKEKAMGVKFEIEAKYKTGKKRNEKYFVFAKCLEIEKEFKVTDNSRLGEIEISKFLTQPRATDKEGKPRFDIFIFKIRYKKDCDELEEGQIVELIENY